MVTPTDQSSQSTSGADTAKDSNDNGSSSLKPAQRNIVVGVVVGVGGAILLGGLGVVFWRLRRKRGNPVDEDDLMRRDGSPLAESRREMHSTTPDASPFQATLNQYHQPPGPVNASSNF